MRLSLGSYFPQLSAYNIILSNFLEESFTALGAEQLRLQFEGIKERDLFVDRAEEVNKSFVNSTNKDVHVLEDDCVSQVCCSL